MLLGTRYRGVTQENKNVLQGTKGRGLYTSGDEGFRAGIRPPVGYVGSVRAWECLSDLWRKQRKTSKTDVRVKQG